MGYSTGVSPVTHYNTKHIYLITRPRTNNIFFYVHKPSSLPSFAIIFSWISLELLSSFKYLSVLLAPILSPYIFFYLLMCPKTTRYHLLANPPHSFASTSAFFALFVMNTSLLYEIFTPNLSFNPLPESVQLFALKSASSLNFVSP